MAGYNVYINNQYVTTVLTNSYSTTVVANTLYSFYVVAFDEEPRQFSSASSSLTLPESLILDDLTIPPSVPEALGGSIDGNSVSLVWQASTDDEAVLGYNVYRDNQYLTTVSNPAYTGFNVEDESHCWYVVAFDIRTNFSARSERIVLPGQGPVDTTIAPSVPTGLAGDTTTSDGRTQVQLSWTASTSNVRVAGYNIYRNNDYYTTVFTNAYIDEVRGRKIITYAFQLLLRLSGKA